MISNWNKHISGCLVNIKLELIDEWKYALRLWSMRWILIGAFCAGSAAAYQWLPPDWLPEIPATVKKYLGLGALVSMGMAGTSRVVKQNKLREVIESNKEQE